MLKKSGDGDCIGVQLGSQGLHEREHTPGAKAHSAVSPMRPKAEALGYLDVVPQEIVVIESSSGDGGLLFDTGVRSMPVVLVVEG